MDLDNLFQAENNLSYNSPSKFILSKHKKFNLSSDIYYEDYLKKGK